MTSLQLLPSKTPELRQVLYLSPGQCSSPQRDARLSWMQSSHIGNVRYVAAKQPWPRSIWL